MAWEKKECEADALRSHEKVIGSVVNVASLEVFMDGVIQHHVTTDPLAVRVLETPEEFLLCCGVASTLMLCGTWNPLRQSMELKGLQLDIRPGQLAH